MKYLLLIHSNKQGWDEMPAQWTENDIKVMVEYMHEINRDLQAAGELVEVRGLTGPDQLQPVDARFPRRAKVTVRFGKPLDFAGRFEGVAPGRARREATDEIMDAIHALTGQERVEAYNEGSLGL